MASRKIKEKVDAEIILKFARLPKEDKIMLVSYLANELKRTHNISEHEIFGRKEISIPVEAFGNDSLSSLEVIVKYMKEELNIKFSRIAKLLNRSSKTIWATYHNSIKKMPSPFGIVNGSIMIPVSVLSNRSFSALESVVGFIKGFGYSNHEVAVMLHLDDRTIWTVYDRVKSKRGREIE